MSASDTLILPQGGIKVFMSFELFPSGTAHNVVITLLAPAVKKPRARLIVPSPLCNLPKPVLHALKQPEENYMHM